MNSPCITPEQAATGLLLRQRLRSLFLDVTGLRYDKRIVFDSMQHYCAITTTTMADLRSVGDTQDGCTVKLWRRGKPLHVVLYNEDADNPRRRSFTLAHEVGHIYLEHEDDQPRREREADRFAAQLLMPEALVREMHRRYGGGLTPRDLCEVFNVSQSAARNRLRGLDEAFSITEEDRLLLDKLGGLLPDPAGPIVSLS